MPQPFQTRVCSAEPTPTTTAHGVSKDPYSEDHVLRVGGGTNCKNLAKAIIGVLDNESRCPVLEYVGAAACAQAIKAVAIASDSLRKSSGRYISVIPTFCSRAMDDNPEVTAIQLRILVMLL